MSDDKYNDGYTHEALHTLYVLMDTFNNHVLETRCAHEYIDVRNAAEDIHEAMCDLYQLIGNKFKEET